MAVELEKLVVTVAADNTDLKAKLVESRREAEKQAGGIQDAFKELGGGVGGIIDQLGSFKGAIIAAAGFGGIAALVKSTIDAADELNGFSQQTGLSTKFIQEMRYAASQLNVEQGTLTQSLSVFTKKIGEAVEGNAEAKKSFDILKVSVTETSGQTKTAEQLFAQVADRIQKVDSASERAAIAQELFGRSGQAMVNILAAGSSGLSELQRKANELGLVLEDRLIKGADETNDKLSTLAQVSKAKLSVALLELAPAISGVADWLLKLSERSMDAARGWGALIRMFSGTETPDDKLMKLNEQLKVLKQAHAPADQIKAVESAMMNLIDSQNKSTESKTKSTTATKSLIAAENERLELAKKAQAIADKAVQDDPTSRIQKEIETLRKAEDEKIKIKGDYNELWLEKEVELEEAEEAQYVQQVQDLIAQNEAMRDIDDKKYSADIAANQTAIDKIRNARVLFQNDQLKLDKKIIDDKKKLNEQEMQDRLSALNFIATLQYSKSKEMAVVGKVAAVTAATIATYEAATKAYSALAGIPIVGPALGAAAAAAAIAAGLSNVAKITGVDIGFNQGVDFVPGIGSTDSVRAMLTPGERVVKKDTNAILEDFLLDYRANGDRASGVGDVTIRLELKDELMDFIETKLVERGRIGVSLVAA
jgi:hypothetical protein